MENFLRKCPDNICRTCLCESADMRSLHSKIDEDRTLLENLSFLLNLRIITQEKLPGQVCKGCEDIICKASTFKRRCFEVETLLEQCMGDCLQTDKKTEETHFKPKNLVQESEKLNLASGHSSVTSKNFVDTRIIHTNDIFKTDDSGHSSNVDSNSKNSQSGTIIIKEEEEELNFDASADTEFCTETFEVPTIECNIQIKKCNRKLVKKLGNHNKSNYTRVTCTECSKSFDSWRAYQKHENLHKSKLVKKVKNPNQSISTHITCAECGKLFDSWRAYQKHEQLHNTKRTNPEEFGKFKCSQCLRQFKKKSSIVKHLKQHEVKSIIKHVCQTCKREFKHKAHLDNHILSLHTREKGHTCILCSLSFSTEQSLEIHKDSHSIEKKHQCDICKKAFVMLSTLTDHMRTHTGEKPFLCSICGKGFSQKTNLAQHVRRHQGFKPFGCDHCDRSFVSKGELNAHARKHSGAHPFICDDCGGGFTTSSSLVKHRRTHTGERPYACDLCPMKFAASGTLKNHRRTHTGEKPYKCHYCEKAFVQRHDLISHIRCHTGERPYTCECGQAFRKASALKSHLKIHSKEGHNDGLPHSDTTMSLKGLTVKDVMEKTASAIFFPGQVV